MPNVPFPNEDPEAWDTPTLGNFDLPGVSKVDVDNGDDLDMQKKKGGQGSEVVYHGKNPSKIKVTTTVWTPTQLAQLQLVIQSLRPTNARKADPNPLRFVHPQAAMFGISTVVIESISAKAPDPGDRYIVEWSLVEYFPQDQDANSSASKRMAPRSQQLADVVPTAEATKPSTQP